MFLILLFRRYREPGRESNSRKDRTVRIAAMLLALSLAGPATATFAQSIAYDAKVANYVNSLPPTKPPEYTETDRLALAANPLGCEEHPQAVGLGTGFDSDGGRETYLWRSDGWPEIASDYDHRLAFYGCHDWHSSARSGNLTIH